MPTGAPKVVTAGVTVAVRVTEVPGVVLETLEARDVVVATAVGTTASGWAADELLLSVVSPAKTAVRL